jgi:hypothetical protein
VARLLEREKDWRVKLWARVLLGGEPLTALAREWGYSDPSGVHQVVRRLAAKAESDRALARKLETLKKAATREMGL